MIGKIIIVLVYAIFGAVNVKLAIYSFMNGMHFFTGLSVMGIIWMIIHLVKEAFKD